MIVCLNSNVLQWSGFKVTFYPDDWRPDEGFSAPREIFCPLVVPFGYTILYTVKIKTIHAATNVRIGPIISSEVGSKMSPLLGGCNLRPAAGRFGPAAGYFYINYINWPKICFKKFCRFNLNGYFFNFLITKFELQKLTKMLNKYTSWGPWNKYTTSWGPWRGGGTGGGHRSNRTIIMIMELNWFWRHKVAIFSHFYPFSSFFGIIFRYYFCLFLAWDASNKSACHRRKLFKFVFSHRPF